MPDGLRLTIASLLFAGIASTALAHGHPITVADDDPEAPRLRLCQKAEDEALQALHDRDRGRPTREIGPQEPHAMFLNALIREVHEQVQIRSPKFVQGVARSRCNEYWLSHQGDRSAP
ncbi:MAG: hypothetical protein KGN39_09000 [Betaproteobacteria bacterium]|nr:hypothetical protein [Betaproteobacteria bacterium]